MTLCLSPLKTQEISELKSRRKVSSKNAPKHSNVAKRSNYTFESVTYRENYFSHSFNFLKQVQLKIKVIIFEPIGNCKHRTSKQRNYNYYLQVKFMAIFESSYGDTSTITNKTHATVSTERCVELPR